MTRTLQLQSWSCKCLLAYWNLAHHVTNFFNKLASGPVGLTRNELASMWSTHSW